jgi:hypothetical protein
MWCDSKAAINKLKHDAACKITEYIFGKYSRTLLRSLSRDQRIRDSLSGKTSLLKAIGFRDFKNQTSYRGKLLMRGLLIRVLLYVNSIRTEISAPALYLTGIVH